VDTIPFILAAVRHAFDGYGLCPSDAEWIAGIGTPLRVQLASFARLEEDVDGLFDRYRTYWLAEHDRRTRPFPGAVEVVEGLAASGHPIGVVTAKLSQGAHRTLRHVGLDRLVGVVVGADTTSRSKPHPDPVLYALERLGRTPGAAVLVGDSTHDVAAALAAGVRPVGALWGVCDRAELAAAGADVFAADVGELPAIVRGLDPA